jgi:hypothetical protein
MGPSTHRFMSEVLKTHEDTPNIHFVILDLKFQTGMRLSVLCLQSVAVKLTVSSRGDNRRGLNG